MKPLGMIEVEGGGGRGKEERDSGRNGCTSKWRIMKEGFWEEKEEKYA